MCRNTAVQILIASPEIKGTAQPVTKSSPESDSHAAYPLGNLINQTSESGLLISEDLKLGKRQRKTTAECLSTEGSSKKGAPTKRVAGRGRKASCKEISNDDSSSNLDDKSLSDEDDDIDGLSQLDKKDKKYFLTVFSNPPFSRLIQNRKSAMKCRLKKKAEFDRLKDDFSLMREEKIILQ